MICSRDMPRLSSLSLDSSGGSDNEDSTHVKTLYRQPSEMICSREMPRLSSLSLDSSGGSDNEDSTHVKTLYRQPSEMIYSRDMPRLSSLSLDSSGGSDNEDSTHVKTLYRQPSGRRRPLIFVTYAEDNVEGPLKLCKKLISCGFVVKCDMYQGVFHRCLGNPSQTLAEMMKNTNDWIKYNFQEAKYVIVCISPLYFKYTNPENDVSQHPSENRLHTKYIYNRVQSELMENLCQNERFIPVIFSYTGAKVCHIPSALKSTIFYYYPDYYDTLRLFLSSR